MKRTVLLAAVLLSVSQYGSAQNIDVEITNLTHGIYFTPILIAAHDAETSLFEVGSAASAELQAMAEGGDLAGLIADLDSLGAVSVGNPAGGLLGPATSTSTMGLDAGELGVLSIVSMLLPTMPGSVLPG